MTNNDWDPLKEIIVGSATGARLPVNCPKFRELEKTTGWTETPVPSGNFPQHVIDEANEDLENLSDTLKSLGVLVHRPKDLDFASFDGMYNYCPRDRVLILGNNIIDAPMTFPTRKPEIKAIEEYLKGPRYVCHDEEVFFDAANVCRLGKDLIYLVSDSGNVEGGLWLSVMFPEYKVYTLENAYGGVHIDSTIVPVREGLVVLNADRINHKNLPEPFWYWDKIWISKKEIKETCVTWNHSLSEIFNSLKNNGLPVIEFREYDYSPYNCFQELEEFEPKKFRFKKHGDKLPMVYALVAQKK